MNVNTLTQGNRKAFRGVTLYRTSQRRYGTLTYLKQKSSFLIAALCLLTFLAGNMVGELGWHAFWASVLGESNDTLFVFKGTVAPIEFVTDNVRWAAYGPIPEDATYRQVPLDVLRPLPSYVSEEQRRERASLAANDVYSVGNMGSYRTHAEGKGAHTGIDILAREGTPVRSIAAGIVSKVKTDAYGFGKYIVIRHPNVPDPRHSGTLTTLHSVYAHLSAQFVTEGQIVEKGQQIGLVGHTGFATASHLHFQIDRDEAAWHPYWSFTTAEATAAGMSFIEAINAGLHQERGLQYTENPMLFVQANLNVAPGTTIVKREAGEPAIVADVPAVKPAPKEPIYVTMLRRRDERRKQRLLGMESAALPAAPMVATAMSVPAATVRQAHFDIEHDREFAGREWETVRIVLLDNDGHTITGGSMTSDLRLTAAYGEAEFDPPVLSPLDFKDGEAAVKVLPHGQRTLVIALTPLGANTMQQILSAPMRYAKR